METNRRSFIGSLAAFALGLFGVGAVEAKPRPRPRPKRNTVLIPVDEPATQKFVQISKRPAYPITDGLYHDVHCCEMARDVKFRHIGKMTFIDGRYFLPQKIVSIKVEWSYSGNAFMNDEVWTRTICMVAGKQSRRIDEYEIYPLPPGTKIEPISNRHEAKH